MLAMFLLMSLEDWLTAGGAVVSFMTVTGIPLARKIWTMAKEKGMAETAASVPGLLLANREALGSLYRQLKGIVKAVEVKEQAVQAVFENMPPDAKASIKKVFDDMASGTAKELTALDLAKIPFKDIVNDKLIKENEINDELIKSLVESAKKDEATNVAIDKVASVIGGIAGEGLNIATKVATGGTVGAKDIASFLSGVLSSGMGARRAA